MKKTLFVIGICLLFLAGMALTFYPDVSNWLAKQNQSAAVQEYNSALAEMTAVKMQEERQKAKEYNDALPGGLIEDPFVPGGAVLPENYTSTLNFNGIIGYIEIPAISVSLPIYHGAGGAVLKKGAGHMEMTAFPIGGEGNHTALTGHTGLPSAKLFTDLDKLTIGNLFFISVLDETLAYEVDQILVVKPENTENLRPVKGEDYVTLITCTPYAINSHRLLVRGTRIPYEDDEEIKAEEAAKAPEKTVNWRVVIVAAVVVLPTAVFGAYKFANRRKKRGRL